MIAAPLILRVLFFVAPPDAGPVTPETLGAADVPIVAHNLVSARQRALEDAFFQVVDRTFAALLAEAGVTTPSPALVTFRSSLRTRARRYARSYRILVDEERAGSLHIEIDVDVDRAALRREIERTQVAAAPVAAGPLSVLITGTGPTDAASALAAALGAVGVRVDARPGAAASPALAREVARKGGHGVVAFYASSLDDEGIVRGTGKSAVQCRVALAWLVGAAERPALERTRARRGFGEGPRPSESASTACFARLAADLVREAAPVLAAAGGVGPRVVTVVVALDEPAVLDQLQRAISRIGSVSGCEPRRITVGQAELRVLTRLAAPALAAAVVREATTLEVTIDEAIGDVLRVHARTRPPAAAPGSAATPTGAAPPPGAP